VEVPVSNEDYLNPKKNPFILTHPEDDDADDKTLMIDPDGTGMPPVFAEKDADPLRGLDIEKVKQFIGDAGTAYVYDRPFYSPDEATPEERLSMKPRLLLTRDGDNVSVKRADGVAVVTEEEAELVRVAIEQKAKQGE
jgi:hypothetical protein